MVGPWWALLKLARSYLSMQCAGPWNLVVVLWSRRCKRLRRRRRQPEVDLQVIWSQDYESLRSVCSVCCQSATRLWRGMSRVSAGCKTCAEPWFGPNGTWTWDTYSSVNTVLERPDCADAKSIALQGLRKDTALYMSRSRGRSSFPTMSCGQARWSTSRRDP